jgi:hypothetical protein
MIDSLICYRDISQRLRNITTECRNEISSQTPKRLQYQKLKTMAQALLYILTNARERNKYAANY